MHKKKAFGVAFLIIGMLLCIAVAGPGCEGGGKKGAGVPGRSVAKPEQVQAQRVSLVSDLVEGRKIFEAKNCSQCHSIFERERKAGPKLKTSRFYGSFLDIFSLLWNHAPAMAVHMRKEVLERPQFSATELNHLVSFLYMLPYLGQPGDPRRGEALLNEKACFSCHSLGGRGKKDGISLDSLAVFQSQVVLLQRMWNHGPMMLSRMAATRTRIPTFSGNDFMDLFAALTEQGKERRKVFLGVGNAANGQKMFTEKGCIRCHPIFGKGGKEAPDLGKAVSQSNVTVLSTRLWNHVAGMREKFQQKKLEWPNFSETEMNDLIVFLYSLNYEDKPGVPGKGESVFTRKKCADCHFKTAADKQKIVGEIKSVNSLQFATLLWNHIPSMEASMVIHAVPWPEMSGQELRDVLAYLQSQ
ncbi:MAG: c-type cytochrome [Deltaproteobacteria bacterium]|nr:c-type cytochrome [Deltaproteobacteria bacterium]